MLLASIDLPLQVQSIQVTTDHRWTPYLVYAGLVGALPCCIALKDGGTVERQGGGSLSRKVPVPTAQRFRRRTTRGHLDIIT